jgi:hypothetical protein
MGVLHGFGPIWLYSNHTSLLLKKKICIPFWPNKAMRDLHCWEWQQSSSCSFFFFFLAYHSLMDRKTCYVTLRFASDYLPSILHAQHFVCWQTTSHPTSGMRGRVRTYFKILCEVWWNLANFLKFCQLKLSGRPCNKNYDVLEVRPDVFWPFLKPKFGDVSDRETGHYGPLT